MPKVSVIIPVYGVEKYIERCARSLFEQTLNDIEFFFIDDCTPDKSIGVLNNVIQEYKSCFDEKQWVVKVLKMQKNSGLPAVRKYGVSLATGDYIIHCDSDDWVDITMFEKMYLKAVEDGADMVVCDYEIVGGLKTEIVKSFVPEDTDIIKNFIIRRNKCCVWNKLVRRDLYFNSKLIYPVDNMGEDLALVLQLVLFCKSITYISEPMYKYFYNCNSISHEQSDASIVMRWKQLYNNVLLVVSIYEGNGLSQRYEEEFTSLLFHTKQQIESVANRNAKYYSLWKNTFPEINSRILFNKYINLKDKIKYLFTLLKSNCTK